MLTNGENLQSERIERIERILLKCWIRRSSLIATLLKTVTSIAAKCHFLNCIRCRIPTSMGQRLDSAG